MGKMQSTLESLLETRGQVAHKKLAYPGIADGERAGLLSDVSDVYRRVGGVLDDFELNLSSWDMQFEGIAVELDEYLHFNRYRLLTLESLLYSRLSGFPLEKYVEYCSVGENRCLSAGSYGGKWTSPSTEWQFGPAGTQGELEGAGAPRWRQRAFYDFVKDLSPELIDVKLVRIAVWDRVAEDDAERTVEEVLKSPSAASAEGIVELILERSV